MNIRALAADLEMGEDEFLELVELFLDASVSDLEKLKNAVNRREMKEIVESAHSIKGAAANLGMKELSETAKRIEMNAREDRLDGAASALRMIRESLDRIAQSLDEQNPKFKAQSSKGKTI